MSNEIWESERQQTVGYVERRWRSAIAFHNSVFHRINAHVEYVEHRRAARQLEPPDEQEDHEGLEDEHAVLPDGDALAFDFLGDVDADDMKSLDAAVEASTGRRATTTDTTVVVSIVPPAAAPIAMPSELISSVPPPPVDTGVSALMDELQIDVNTLSVHAMEESKTEESTPPRHVREQQVSSGSPEIKVATKPAQDQFKAPVDDYDPEAVVKEMLSWVDGARHPDVIKRKESLRGEQRPRVTQRYGAGVYEEQVTIRKVTKLYAGEGDDSSSSSSDASHDDSDFEPMEDAVDDDADVDEEPCSDTELLPSEDDLDENLSTWSKRKVKQRRRVRQQDCKKQEKQRKSAVPPSRRNKNVIDLQLESESDEAPAKDEPATTSNDDHVHAKPPRREGDEDLKATAHKLTIPGEGLKAVFASTATTSEIKSIVTKVPTSEVKSSDAKTTPLEEKASSTTAKASEMTPSGTKVQEVHQTAVVSDPPRAAASPPTDTATVKLVLDATSERTDLPGRSTKNSTGDASDHDMEEEDEGYGTDVLPDEEDAVDQALEAADDNMDVSDTETMDLEQEELHVPVPDAAQRTETDGQEDAESPTAPTIHSVGDPTSHVEPVEPNDKRSPVVSHPLPTSPAQLRLDSSSKAIEGGGTGAKKLAAKPSQDEVIIVDSDTDTVIIDEVASQDEIDFGSDSSDDYSGDDEKEFGQFFETPRKKRKLKHAVEDKGAEKRRDASPVKAVKATDVNGGTPEKQTTNRKSKGKDNEQMRESPAKHAPPVGSNGLRKVKNINTTTVAKGKYLQQRRSIVLLDSKMKPVDKSPDGRESDAQDPKSKFLQRSRYPSSPSNHHEGIRLLTLKRSRSDETHVETDRRYLGYSRSAPKPSIKDKYADAAKMAKQWYAPSESRTPSETSRQLEFSLVGAGDGILTRKDEAKEKKDYYVPPRDPQIDVYQATGAVSQVDDVQYDLNGGHKRPSQFVKDIDDKKKRGIDVKKGLPDELNEKAKIPKKSKSQLAQERVAVNSSSAAAAAKGVDRHNCEPVTKKQKKATASSEPSAPSKYGPSSGSARGSRSNKELIANAFKKKNNGKAPERKSRADTSYDYDRKKDFRSYDDRRDRDYREKGRDRSRERRRERSRSQERSRDRSRDRSQGRSQDRDRARDRSTDRERERDSRREKEHRRSSRSRDEETHRDRDNSYDFDAPEPTPHTSEPRPETSRPEASEPSRGGKPRSAEVQRPLPSYEMPELLAKSMKPQTTQSDDFAQDVPGALATSDDYDDGEILDSDEEIPVADDDGEEMARPRFKDIKVDLDQVVFDESFRERMIYVTNIPPQMEEGMIQEILEAFDVAVDRSTGFPAIEVFFSQRTHRPRGDGRVMFVSAEEAKRAASELNCAIFAHSKLMTRAMDRQTMQILAAQFDTPRDTWCCPNAACRADVTVWTAVCPSCSFRRQFVGSNVKIGQDDWLCSICYTSNDRYASKCNTCCAELPPISSSQQNTGRTREWDRDHTVEREHRADDRGWGGQDRGGRRY